jgi:hypothetical protein
MKMLACGSAFLALTTFAHANIDRQAPVHPNGIPDYMRYAPCVTLGDVVVMLIANTSYLHNGDATLPMPGQVLLYLPPNTVIDFESFVSLTKDECASAFTITPAP